MANETAIKRALVKKLKTIEAIWFYCASDKFTSVIPDVLIVYKGYFVAIELKDPKKPSQTHRKLQAYVRSLIQKAGGYAAECSSVEESINFIKECVYDSKI